MSDKMTHSEKSDNYQICTKTVMDNIADPNITFDENGVCNYYYEYFEKHKKHVREGDEGLRIFNEKIELIKKNGKGKKYDCIIGVSGGVDSTYLAYLAKENNLRALLVHFDNGWDSELAVKNIENLVNILGFDLYSLVVNWEEFKELQLAYFRSSVIDIEMPSDHAILGTMYKLAAKHKVKYFLSGFNIVTEAILPEAWNFDKFDAVNMKDIYKKHGNGLKLSSYPFFGLAEKKKYVSYSGVQSAVLLNYINYNKAEVKKIITEKLGWIDYGGKHYESIFTRFYQGYILPEKFNIDKRKAHLSTLVCSKQITREEALEELAQDIYPPKLLVTDKEFVLKKLGFTEEEFENVMNLPIKSHYDYATGKHSVYEVYPILKIIKPIVSLWTKRK